MPERTVIQWDKDDLEELGLLKVDVLGLGMLSAMRRSFELIERFDGRKLHARDRAGGRRGVYEMIWRADTIGVFQIESRAQMAMLPRLKPKKLLRPGDRGGHHAARPDSGRHGASLSAPPHRRGAGQLSEHEVERVLERTLGVPIFQEQVMQLAIVAAGFTPGEADSCAAQWRPGGAAAISGSSSSG